MEAMLDRQVKITGTGGRQRSLSRRSFVACSAVALAGAAFLKGEIADAAAASVPRSLVSLDLATFKKCVGQEFRARHGLGLTGFKLVSTQVSGSSTKTTNPAQECFMLSFRRVQGTAIPQGSYSLSNPTLGNFSLFVVPNGDAAKQYYTAVINRVTRS